MKTFSCGRNEAGGYFKNNLNENKMTEKLTLEDCYKYPKARIKADTKDFKNVFTFTIYSFNSNLSSNQILREENCKLILRDISQLTDEEKKYIAKNFLLVDWGVLEGRTNQITLIHIMSWCEFEKLKDLLDYFREIGIDIDGMLASGRAVKG